MFGLGELGLLFGLGGQELLIIMVIVLVIFGGAKIPELARGLGQGMREFRKAQNEIDKDPEPESVER